MYITLLAVILLLFIINVIYFRNKGKITKELRKIEKENGIDKKSVKDKRGKYGK